MGLGSNEVGACGSNAHGFQKVPAKTFGQLAGVAVSAGSVHSVVLAAPRAVAKVVELGDSSSSEDPLTLPLVCERTGPADVADSAAGWNHVLALDGQHRVWSWATIPPDSWAHPTAPTPIRSWSTSRSTALPAS